MVDVLMGDKDMMDLLPVISGSADLVKDTVAAAPVDQEQLPAVVEDKAGIVAFGHQRIAGPQHGQFHHGFLTFFPV